MSALRTFVLDAAKARVTPMLSDAAPDTKVRSGLQAVDRCSHAEGRLVSRATYLEGTITGRMAAELDITLLPLPSTRQVQLSQVPAVGSP